jgi:CHAT domain-containing protein/uncharacterized protein HemY
MSLTLRVALPPLTLLSLTLILAAGPTHARSPNPVSFPEARGVALTPGATLGGEARAGEGDSYEVALAVGQYLRLLVSKKGDVGLSVTVYGPDGREAAAMNVSRSSPFSFSFIALSEGIHRVVVRSAEAGADGSRYELKVEALRRAAPQDQKNNAAVWAFAEAEKLRARWEEDSLRRAAEEYASAAALWGSTGDRSAEAAALNGIGELHFILNEYDKALDFFAKAFARSRAAGDRRGEQEALNNIGYVYVYRGRNSQALAHFERALTYRARPGRADDDNDRRVEAQTLNNMGEVYYSLGNLNKALGLFNRALALWNDAADRKGQALAHLNIGYTYYDMGDTRAASDCYERSLSLWRAVNDRRGEALSSTALGGVRSFRGEKQSALDLHEQAASSLRAIGDHMGEASALNGVGRVYEEMNQPETALDKYGRALQLYQLIGNRDYEALNEYYIGRVYRSTGDLQQALTHYRLSLATAKSVGDRRLVAYALKDIGTIYGTMGERQRALSQYLRVLSLYRDFGDRRGQAHTLNSMGLLSDAAGEWRLALGYYRRALPLYQSAVDLGGEAATRYNIARAARASGELDEALSQIKAAIEIVEAMRVQVASYELRSSYFASVHQYYGFYVDLLIQLHERDPSAGYAATALGVNESALARSLNELLTEAKVDIRQGVPADLLERERALQEQLSTRAKYQARLRNDRRTEGEAATIEQEIRALTTEYQEVQARIREQSPRYAALVRPQPLSVADIQSKLLDDETVLLEYALGEEHSHLWVVTNSSVAHYALPGRAVLEKSAREVYDLLTARQTVPREPLAEYERRVEQADADYWNRASELSRMLLGQAAPLLESKRLLVVPDGALQYIPFEALPAPPQVSVESQSGGATSVAGEPEPLLLRHEVVSLPSASTLASLRQDVAAAAPERKLVAVLADPVFDLDDPRVIPHGNSLTNTVGARLRGVELRNALRDSNVGRGGDGSVIPRLPSSQNEAESIISAAPRGEGMVVTGFDASRARAISGELGQYRIVHFATHGFINNEHPELSGIVLSLVNERGDPEDGFLQLHDIYNLKLSADLVVLSACSTGLGKEIKGEGLVGLTRGFMYAGSRSVMASLWKVEDHATAELMGHFYDGLLKDGLPPPAALRAAKEAMWRKRRWHSPFFWAAFELQGEYHWDAAPRPTGGTGRGAASALVIIVATLLGCFYGIKLLRRKSAAR